MDQTHISFRKHVLRPFTNPTIKSGITGPFCYLNHCITRSRMEHNGKTLVSSVISAFDWVVLSESGICICRACAWSYTRNWVRIQCQDSSFTFFGFTSKSLTASSTMWQLSGMPYYQRNIPDVERKLCLGLIFDKNLLCVLVEKCTNSFTISSNMNSFKYLVWRLHIFSTETGRLSIKKWVIPKEIAMNATIIETRRQRKQYQQR